MPNWLDPQDYDPTALIARSPLLRLLVDDILAASIRPRPVFALGSALSLAAHSLCARFRIPVFDNLRLNLYVILAGHTAAGKEGPITRLQGLLSETKQPRVDRVVSHQSFEERFFNHGPTQIICPDDGSDLFDNFNSQNTYQSGLLQFLLRTYGAKELVRRYKQDEDKVPAKTKRIVAAAISELTAVNVAIPPSLRRAQATGLMPIEPPLKDPHLSVCMTVTPKSIEPHLNQANTQNGLLNRFIYVFGDGLAAPQTVTPQPAPQAYVAAVKHALLLAPTQTTISVDQDVIEYFRTDKFLRELTDWAETEYDDPSDVIAMMSRVQQNAFKVAGIIAATRFIHDDMTHLSNAGNGGGPAGAFLDIDDFKEAIGFVLWCAKRIARDTLQASSNSRDLRPDVVKLRDYLQGCKNRELRKGVPEEEAGWRTHTKILKSIKDLQAKKLKDALNSLVQSQEVAHLPTGNAKGRPGFKFRML